MHSAAEFSISVESPRQPEVVALIDALDAWQKPLYPPESHHGIDIETLAGRDVVFAVARDADGQALGCAALVLRPAYGELKRMYVEPALRGHGIGRALLRFMEEQGRLHGCACIALETGHLQADALALYTRQGYLRTAPFGDYVADPNSVFMRKSLGAGCP